MDPRLLAKVEFFQGLPEDCTKAIAGLAQPERHRAETEIFKEGEAGDRLYIIQSGSIRISKHSPTGGEEALAILHAGQHFGEMALIDDAPRSAFAIANEDSTLLSIGRNEFQSMLRADRDLAYHILMQLTRTLATRLRETNEKIQGFLAMSMWG